LLLPGLARLARQLHLAYLWWATY
jgi:hypothetical protein